MDIRGDKMKYIYFMFLSSLYFLCTPHENINYLSDGHKYLKEEIEFRDALINYKLEKVLEHLSDSININIEHGRYETIFNKNIDKDSFIKKTSILHKILFDMESRKTQKELSNLLNTKISRCLTLGSNILLYEKTKKEIAVPIAVNNLSKKPLKKIYRSWQLTGPDLDRKERGGTCDFDINWECSVETKKCKIIEIRAYSYLPIDDG